MRHWFIDVASLVILAALYPSTVRAQQIPVRPLAFEANEGQADSRVKFLSRGSGRDLFLTSTEAVLVFPNAPSVALRMTLRGANTRAAVTGIHAILSPI